MAAAVYTLLTFLDQVSQVPLPGGLSVTLYYYGSIESPGTIKAAGTTDANGSCLLPVEASTQYTAVFSGPGAPQYTYQFTTGDGTEIIDTAGTTGPMGPPGTNGTNGVDGTPKTISSSNGSINVVPSGGNYDIVVAPVTSASLPSGATILRTLRFAAASGSSPKILTVPALSAGSWSLYATVTSGLPNGETVSLVTSGGNADWNATQNYSAGGGFFQLVQAGTASTGQQPQVSVTVQSSTSNGVDLFFIAVKT